MTLSSPGTVWLVIPLLALVLKSLVKIWMRLKPILSRTIRWMGWRWTNLTMLLQQKLFMISLRSVWTWKPMIFLKYCLQDHLSLYQVIFQVSRKEAPAQSSCQQAQMCPLAPSTSQPQPLRMPRTCPPCSTPRPQPRVPASKPRCLLSLPLPHSPNLSECHGPVPHVRHHGRGDDALRDVWRKL